MQLSSRLSLFATEIGAKIKSMMVRLPPTGGTTGQALVKASANDSDYAWQTVPNVATENEWTATQRFSRPAGQSTLVYVRARGSNDTAYLTLESAYDVSGFQAHIALDQAGRMEIRQSSTKALDVIAGTINLSPSTAVTAPTVASGDNSTKVATTAFVGNAVSAIPTYTAGSGLELLNGQFSADTNVLASRTSPVFKGTPTAPTAAAGTNTLQLANTAYVVTSISAKADLASPAFSGTPTAPTAAAGTSTTQLATTAFVTTADNLKAPIASPTFTGTPAGPTPAVGTATTQFATTAFVHNQVASIVTKVIMLEILGKMTGGEIVRLFTAPWSGNIGGIAQITAGVAATASTTITITRNGTQVGTLVWAAGATLPSINFTSTTVSAFDVFQFTGPATADATLANITGYFKVS